MNFFKQSSDQAREAFASMPMQSRIITGMLVAAIAIGLAFLVRGDSTGGGEYLFGGRAFSEQELAGMEMAFSAAGLNDWQRDGLRMKIPNESKSEYLAAMKESVTLPMSLHSNVEDAINATTVFDSSQLHGARFDAALERDLGSSISKMVDIKAASVVHDRGQRLGLGRETPQSASVFVQPEGTQPLSRQRVEAIRELVRGAYAGMKPEDVVVTDANSVSGSGFADDEDPLLRKQREAEAWTEQKIRKILVGYPADIAVTAEVDPQMDVEKTSLKYGAEPTNLSNKSRKIETSTNRQPPRGVPGAQPNAIGNRSASLDENLETMKSKEDERFTQGVADQEYENSRLASLQVKQIRVTVGLPKSYYETLHARQSAKEVEAGTIEKIEPMSPDDYETLKSETQDTIKAAVAPLLPKGTAGADPLPLVEVFSYPDLPGPEIEGPDTTKIALTWLAGSWQTIALVCLGLVALLVARSAVGSGGGSAPTEFQEGFGLELPAPPVVAETNEEGDEKMTITGSSLKDELLTLVESNPEVAANVIRGWVGEAA